MGSNSPRLKGRFHRSPVKRSSQARHEPKPIQPSVCAVVFVRPRRRVPDRVAFGAVHNGGNQNGCRHNGCRQNGCRQNGCGHNGCSQNGCGHNGCSHRARSDRSACAESGSWAHRGIRGPRALSRSPVAPGGRLPAKQPRAPQPYVGRQRVAINCFRARGALVHGAARSEFGV